MLFRESIGDAQQHAPKTRTPVSVLGRKVSPTIKRLPVGREKSRQGPSPLSAHCLHRGLIAAVDVGTLVAVYLHCDEMLIHDDPFRGRTEFPLMSVACTLALTQDRASHLWMLSKPLPTKVKTASLALGEIPSVPEKGYHRTQMGIRMSARRWIHRSPLSSTVSDTGVLKSAPRTAGVAEYIELRLGPTARDVRKAIAYGCCISLSVVGNSGSIGST
jgi:hypothetical protein